MTARRRWLRRGGLALLAAAIAWMASGTLAAYVLTKRARPPFAEPGEGYAVPFRALRLRASDGVEIGAWLAERAPARAGVVLVHGNGASRASLADEAAYFHARGCTVLPISVRAHGDSGGDFNDIGWSARHDVIAAVEHLEPMQRPIVIYGSSLGAAAALFAGESLGDRVAGYVLSAPYADLRIATRRRLERYLIWPLDEVAYGAMQTGGRLVLPQIDRIDPAAAAARLPRDTRMVVFAGGDDDRAPASDARRIAARVHGRVVVVPGLDHEDMGALVGRPEWDESVSALLAGVAAR